MADAIRSGPRGGCAGPSKRGCVRQASPTRPSAWALTAVRVQHPGDLNEMAILLTGKHWNLSSSSGPIPGALQAGLDPAIIEAIRTGAEPPLKRDMERALYTFVTEYLATHRLSDSTYKRRSMPSASVESWISWAWLATTAWSR